MIARTLDNPTFENPSTERARDFDRTSPTRYCQRDDRGQRAAVVFGGSLVPIGLAAAAAAVSFSSATERVAVTAWIAVAVVGTASVIASATVLRGFPPKWMAEEKTPDPELPATSDA